DTSNVAVSLVVDCSGSMSGEPMQLAIKTGIALGESLKAIGIEFEMIGFTTGTSGELSTYCQTVNDHSRFNRTNCTLKHFIFKVFGNPDLSGVTMARACSSNADGESVTWAAKRLALRPEKRKIMMVLSDGYPAHACRDHDILLGDLKRVVTSLPKS